MGRPKIFDTAKIREDFINGFSSLLALAQESGVSYSYLSKLASSERWAAKRRERRMSVAEERAASRVGKLARQTPRDPATTKSPKEHVGRSLYTGERIHQLLSETTEAVAAGDVRALKTLVDAWAGWDNQMRKNHRLDDEAAISTPVVNIALLSALPDG
jgi:hypothetical protein